tara:strand:+ start:3890 stop:4156 length:267 start_codon:yes stop_codon:yes gene_type:complete
MYTDKWVEVEEVKIAGKRYPLTRGRLFKANNKRGIYRVHHIYADRQDSNNVEVHAWWRDKRYFSGGKAQWRFVQVKDVKHVLKDVESI